MNEFTNFVKLNQQWLGFFYAYDGGAYAFEHRIILKRAY